jgi:hypothetical protein
MTLPTVLYGCETLSLTSREEARLRVFQNRVLRRIFGPKRDEVTGEWRKLHNGKLHKWYSSPDIIRQFKSRRMRWTGHVTCMGEGRKVYRVLVGKPKGKRPLGRPRHRWEDGIRMDLRETGWGAVERIHLAQDRDLWKALVNAVMNFRVLAPRSQNLPALCDSEASRNVVYNTCVASRKRFLTTTKHHCHFSAEHHSTNYSHHVAYSQEFFLFPRIKLWL